MKYIYVQNLFNLHRPLAGKNVTTHQAHDVKMKSYIALTSVISTSRAQLESESNVRQYTFSHKIAWFSY